jgi:hypothetical protein
MIFEIVSRMTLNCPGEVDEDELAGWASALTEEDGAWMLKSVKVAMEARGRVF